MKQVDLINEFLNDTVTLDTDPRRSTKTGQEKTASSDPLQDPNTQ